MKPELCRVWYLFLFGVCAIILATLDAVLLLRGILVNVARIIANLNWLEPVYAMFRKNPKVYILSLPIALQFIVASVQIERVSRCHNFNPHCNKPTSLMDVGLAGCVFVSTYSVSVTLCSSRGSVVLAHATLLVATFFAKRKVAKKGAAGAAVVRLVVREGAWIILSLIGW